MKTLFRILIVSAAVLMVLTVAGICVLYFAWPSGFRSDWQKPAEQHMASRLHDLQRDRDAILQSFSSAKSHTTIKPDALPASLRVPGLEFALVHRDHITLVMYHSPDTTSGFRIWKSTMPADFADQLTPISFVTRFRYCDDDPESLSNKLE